MAQDVVIQPRIATKNPNKQIKFIAGIVLILLAIVYLIASTISATGAYYVSVSELVAQQDELVGKKIRISGAVAQETENWDALNLMLTFNLTDESGEQMMVSFHGSRPSNFGQATEAIVEGELTEDGVFRADTLMLKCPSRYDEAPEVTQHEALP